MKQNKNKYSAQEKWQKKSGYISKSYKLKRDLVEKFAIACKINNISQAKQLSIFMEEIVDKTLDNVKIK